MENQENIPKFPIGPTSFQTGPDVIKGGCNCSKVCDQVKVIKGNQEDRSGNDQCINNYKDIGRAKHFMRNRLCHPSLFFLLHWGAEKYEVPCGLFYKGSGSWKP